MNRAMDLFDIPKGVISAVDIGCGPRAGIFYVRKWRKMYAVDPSWSFYEKHRLVKLTAKPILIIEDYAQTYKLPEQVDIAFSINALNHSGDIARSIANIMLSLKPGGLFFLHVNLRTSSHDAGHPMPLTQDDIKKCIDKFITVNYNYFPYDPVRGTKDSQHTVAITMKNSQ